MAKPEEKATKAEAVAMMVKAAYGDTYSYDSTNSDSWMKQVVDFAASKGIVSNFTNYDTPATRGFLFEAGNEAVVASEEVVEEACDDISALLGLCDEVAEETPTTETPTTETPVVVSGDNVLIIELSPETPNESFVAGGKDRTQLVAFDVTAGSEDTTLKDVTVEYTGYSDAADFTKMAVYLGNDKVSKGTTKKFDSDNEVELSFENGTVIKAGETKTLFITANVAVNGVVSHKISITDFNSSSSVEMANISSVSFAVINATNSASVTVDTDEVTSTMRVGDVETLADFSVEETSTKENAIVKSITFSFAGFDAQDELDNLSLYADNVEIANELMVNSDDEVIVDLEFVVPSDEKVDFELKGSVNELASSNITATISDIYVVGEETGVIANVTYSATSVADFAIEGSEINVSFDKSDIDEAKPNTDAVSVGTLKLTSTSDYTVERLVVKAVSTSTGDKALVNVIKTVELNGTSEDGTYTTSAGTTEANSGTTTVYYAFEDIALNNETKEFDVTFDINDDVTFNGESVVFTVSIVTVKDEEDNSDAILADVLSTNSLDSKTIDIKSADITVTETTMTANELVLGNGVEVVLYKGKLNAGDADDVEINKITFDGSLKTSTGVAITAYDYEDILDNATLNIGGQTFDADINPANIKFTGMSAVVAAGSNNVEVTLTARLKDNDTVNQ
ncbi:hypothetical protein ACFLY2_00520 [Patescibacteria group bacterium]